MSLYHCLLAYSRVYHYQPGNTLPFVPADFRSSLLRHLLSEERYGDAVKVAKLSGYSEDSLDNTTMLEAILAEKGLPDLQRAELLWGYGDKLRVTRGGAEWRDSLSTAAELYCKAGHATGALDVRVDLLRHGRDGSASVSQNTKELWRIMAAMESAGNWSSVNRCLVAIIDINSGEFVAPSESLQAKVKEEWLRVSKICSKGPTGMSASVTWVLGWQLIKSRTVKALSYLEHFHEQIKDCDALAMITIVLMTLHATYTSMGDDAKATECVSRCPEALPRSLPPSTLSSVAPHP